MKDDTASRMMSDLEMRAMAVCEAKEALVSKRAKLDKESKEYNYCTTTFQNSVEYVSINGVECKVVFIEFPESTVLDYEYRIPVGERMIKVNRLHAESVILQPPVTTVEDLMQRAVYDGKESFESYNLYELFRCAYGVNDRRTREQVKPREKTAVHSGIICVNTACFSGYKMHGSFRFYKLKENGDRGRFSKALAMEQLVKEAIKEAVNG